MDCEGGILITIEGPEGEYAKNSDAEVYTCFTNILARMM